MGTLELVKARLGISSSKRDDYLNAIIDGLEKELKEIQGLILDSKNLTHQMFIADYACYRYENKGEQSGLPRHLQWRLHNLIIGNKNADI
ncbi:phage head-tail connector protein [Miniphocaeibacter massiliensis]|uniref:phage head-tail connector protein n=1 Tax=Miniphocaeibacter massiliensis TaxID=2041841 RepID=UPI000C1C0D92|nr:phage head-tail connector protein [Miniphocaeibacter massiliensis]